jgi:hypothetical protein
VDVAAERPGSREIDADELVAEQPANARNEFVQVRG